MVQELAHRGFTLRKLLEFVEGLTTGQKYMPHFDEDVHTTNDVVRQAIIPATREAACAMATQMMGGKPVRPQKMVTHCWGNRFIDLVAAVVADALGSAEFGL